MGKPPGARSAWLLGALVAIAFGAGNAPEAPSKALLDELETLHFRKPQPLPERRRQLMLAWLSSQPEGKEDVRRLGREVRRLGAEAFAERKAATDAILAMGPWVTKALKMRLLREKDPEIRARIREVLRRQYKQRFVCARRLGNAVLFIWWRMPPEGQVQFAEPLVDAICREPSWVRWTTEKPGEVLDDRVLAGKAAYPRDPRTEAPLLYGLNRERLLRDIMKVVAKQNTPSANRLLVRFLRKPNYLLPIHTIGVLSRSERKGIDTSLELAKLAEEASPNIAFSALTALKRREIGPSRQKILQLLRKAWRNCYPHVALAAAEISLKHGDPGAVPIAVRWARGGTSRRRRAALRALGSPALRAYADRIVPLLTRRLRHKDKATVAEALRALGAFPCTGPKATPFLRDPDPAVRRAAIETLARQPDPAALEALKGLRGTRLDRRTGAKVETAIRLIEQAKGQ